MRCAASLVVANVPGAFGLHYTTTTCRAMIGATRRSSLIRLRQRWGCLRDVCKSERWAGACLWCVVSGRGEGKLQRCSSWSVFVPRCLAIDDAISESGGRIDRLGASRQQRCFCDEEAGQAAGYQGAFGSACLVFSAWWLTLIHRAVDRLIDKDSRFRRQLGPRNAGASDKDGKPRLVPLRPSSLAESQLTLSTTATLHSRRHRKSPACQQGQGPRRCEAGQSGLVHIRPLPALASSRLYREAASHSTRASVYPGATVRIILTAAMLLVLHPDTPFVPFATETHIRLPYRVPPSCVCAGPTAIGVIAKRGLLPNLRSRYAHSHLKLRGT